MMKVLVTGSNGFVGHHLVRELATNGWAVLGVGGSLGTRQKSEYVESYQELDLTKPEEAGKIDFSGVAAVINLAGLTNVGQSFEQPLAYLNVNVGIQVNLFEAALKQGFKPRFLIVSSGTLYDPKAEMPLSEESAVLANSPYAVSKLSQEQMAEYYTTRGFEGLIVRPFNHIGPGQGPGFIVPDLAQQLVAVAAGKQPEIVVGNLDAKRDYTDVRDIVRAYRLLLDKGRSGQIYNVCSGRPLSGHEILEGLSKAAGVTPSIKQDPDKMRPSDTPVMTGSYDKLTADTGWQPEIPLETTFADVIADWRAKLN